MRGRQRRREECPRLKEPHTILATIVTRLSKDSCSPVLLLGESTTTGASGPRSFDSGGGDTVCERMEAVDVAADVHVGTPPGPLSKWVMRKVHFHGFNTEGDNESS